MVESKEEDKVTPEAPVQTEPPKSTGKFEFLRSILNAIKQTSSDIKSADKGEGLRQAENVNLFSRPDPPTLVREPASGTAPKK